MTTDVTSDPTTVTVPAQAAAPDSAEAAEAAAAEAFAGRMLDILNGGALSLMVSIGHRTGLFDVMARSGAVDSAGLAEAAGLQERYVREWLGAMTVGRVVEHDAEAGTFRLPPAHAGFVTRAAGPNNFASFAQTIAMLGKVEDDVVRCFAEGGGVPYSAFPDFQRLMAEDSAQILDATLLDVTVPLVPGLREALQEGIDVLDVGCGRGHAINLLAEAFPASRFVGIDLSEEGVEAGRREARDKRLPNARFEVRDAATLGGPPAFDVVTTFDAVHDQADPAAVLRGIAASLRPGGTYLCVDTQGSSSVAGNLDHPFAPAMYTMSTMHCMTVSLAVGGEGLGTLWGQERALEMLAEAGFADVAVHQVEGDLLNNYYVARRP